MESKAEEQVECGSWTFFFTSPMVLELLLSPPLADGANEPLYAAA